MALHVWSDADMSSIFGLEGSALQAVTDKGLPRPWPAGRNIIPRSRALGWSNSSTWPTI